MDAPIAMSPSVAEAIQRGAVVEQLRGHQLAQCLLAEELPSFRDDDDASLGPANPSRVEMDARPLMQLQIIASLAPPAKKWCLPTASCCRGRPDCDILSPASLIMLPPRMEGRHSPII